MKSDLIERVAFQYALYLPSVPNLCAALAEDILIDQNRNDSETIGLYLLSPDAGAAAAVDFWRSALEVGPALVSPGTFPWTLANGPASCLARLLQVKGPNHTIVGNEKDWPSVLRIAEADLATGSITQGILIYLEVDRQTGFWSKL